MAERIADNPELLVDDMKRKARRRLVGAIVLALAAAIILPMLLEKEPRPLGDDVSVQIPPVDSGKFVNRLTGKGDDKALPKTESKAIAARAGKIRTEGRSSGHARNTPFRACRNGAKDRTRGRLRAGAEAGNQVRSEERTEGGAQGRVQSGGAARARKRAEDRGRRAPSSGATPAQAASANPSAASPAAASATTSKPDGFVVQLAAFADDKGANALANKLKKGGYAAYVEPVNTSRGTLWRVRVGGYVTRPEAETARVALKGEGYSGIIAPAQ
jgi:DedD protein